MSVCRAWSHFEIHKQFAQIVVCCRLSVVAAFLIHIMTTTSSPSFQSKLEARVESIGSILCIGLDPHPNELFAERTDWEVASEQTRCDAAFTFCKTIIDATLPYAAAYKPNAAFFEALGDGGAAVLRRIVRDVIPSDVPVLLDVKRGDIGSTATAYAEACYDHIGADCVTLSPLMGWDSVCPFVTGTSAVYS